MSAEALHDPALEGFTPVNTYQVLGIGYMCLEHASGVKLDLSRHGIEAAGESAAVASLLERMGDYIERHDGYPNPNSAVSDETVEIFLQGSLDPQKNHKTNAEEMHLSSVYHPNSAPETVIKAYDHEPRLATTQFYYGAWLHEGMAEDPGVAYFPRQIALLTAPQSGHRTAVMEYVSGTSTQDLRHLLRAEYSEEEIDRYVAAAAEHVRADVKRALGHKALGIVNDINMPNTNNIIVDDSRPVDLENPADRRLSVIDQPKMTAPITRAQLAAAKRFSSRSWSAPETIPTPSAPRKVPA